MGNLWYLHLILYNFDVISVQDLCDLCLIFWLIFICFILWHNKAEEPREEPMRIITSKYLGTDLTKTGVKETY